MSHITCNHHAHRLLCPTHPRLVTARYTFLFSTPTASSALPMSHSTLVVEAAPCTRKRTTSFSTPNPRPTKVPRMTPKPLRRTTSYLHLPGLGAQDASPASTTTISTTISNTKRSATDAVPYHRTLAAYKEMQLRRKAVLHRRLELEDHSPLTIQIPQREKPPERPPSPVLAPVPAFELRSALTTGMSVRASSPLSPNRILRPTRASFPRAKNAEPDLYRMALKARMGSSPEGRKILLMGPRIALSIMSATQELEKIVSKQSWQDADIIMADGTGTSNSWVVVPGEDWEMIDCGA